MILTDTVTRNIELKLGFAVAANELSWVASYVEFQGNPRFLNTFNQNGVTTGTTAVSIMDATTNDADARQFKALTVCNLDTAVADVIIQYDDNGALRQIVRFTLNPGDMLQYIDTDGFRVFDKFGKIKALGGIALALADGQLPNAKGTLLTAPFNCWIKGITLVSSDGVSYNCNLYLNRSGTSRRIIPFNKPIIDDLQWPFANCLHDIETGDLIEGDASSAAKMDYVITCEAI